MLSPTCRAVARRRRRTVDSFSKRLRQYVAVPADVSPTSASALAVDIRTFPWIRRLAADYAFSFANVAPFYAGRSRHAWRVGRNHRAVARVHTAARGNCARDCRAAGTPRRAGRRARVGGAARGSGHAGHHHRTASRRVRRPALYAAQGHHDHEAGGAGHQGPSRPRGAGVLDRRRRSRLAGGQRVYGARQRVRAHHGAARRSAWRRHPADCPARAHRRHRFRPRSTRTGPSRNRIPP